MIFSVVERQTHKRCKRKWGLQSENRDNLEPVRGPIALSFGTLTHTSLAAWTKQPETLPIQHFFEAAEEMDTQIRHDYEERVGAPISDEELDPWYEALELGQEILTNYKEYYGQPLPDDYTLVDVEQRAIVAIPGTEHWECANGHCPEVHDDFAGSRHSDLLCPICYDGMTWQPHYLRGTFDKLVQDAYGKFWILERKTYAQRPTLAKLERDDQMLAYIWILVQLFGWPKVGGVLYDGIWKRSLKAKRGPDRKIEDLFLRHPFVRSPSEVVEFGRLLIEEANEMARDMQKPLERLPINRVWVGCYDCSFEKLCTAMSTGEDVDYIRETYFKQRTSTIPLDTFIEGDTSE